MCLACDEANCKLSNSNFNSYEVLARGLRVLGKWPRMKLYSPPHMSWIRNFVPSAEESIPNIQMQQRKRNAWWIANGLFAQGESEF